MEVEDSYRHLRILPSDELEPQPRLDGRRGATRLRVCTALLPPRLRAAASAVRHGARGRRGEAGDEEHSEGTPSIAHAGRVW